jgi:phage terminase large subunit-like protein
LRANWAASLNPTQRKDWLQSLTPNELEFLQYDWQFWGRDAQLPPAGAWHTWLVLAGRGFGKTRCGAEWVRACVCGRTPLSGGGYGRIGVVAETASDARDVLVEGPAGLLAVHPKDHRPTYEPSKRRLTWPNGAVATLFNATEPDQLRGPQHDLAWADELAKWRYAQETWDMLQFGLRLGTDPRQCITTTPRPIPIIRDLLKDPGCVTVRGSTYDNRANLAGKFLASIVAKYEGTRLGRQELNAEILDDVPGALWTRAGLDAQRLKKLRRNDGKLTAIDDAGRSIPEMVRIVVAIDPATADPKRTSTDETAETGIVCAGLGTDGRGYVLADATCRATPQGWARKAIALFDMHQADAIVVETNQGGAMVEAVLRAERPTIPVINVHASRGKVTRAEPIAALYEQGRVSHVGTFPEMEDQMVLFTPFGIEGRTTADRVDALVWALTELYPPMVYHQNSDAEDGDLRGDSSGNSFTGY